MFGFLQFAFCPEKIVCRNVTVHIIALLASCISEESSRYSQKSTRKVDFSQTQFKIEFNEDI